MEARDVRGSMKLLLKERGPCCSCNHSLCHRCVDPFGLITISSEQPSLVWPLSLRLADSLQMSIINWHLDFFRDFSQICLTIRTDPGGENAADLDQYARFYGEWRSGAAYPELVSNLYILKQEDRAPASLFAIADPSSGRFEVHEFPNELRHFTRRVAGGFECDF